MTRNSQRVSGLEAARDDWSAERRAQWLIEFARLNVNVKSWRELKKLGDGLVAFLMSAYVSQTTARVSESPRRRTIRLQRPARMILLPILSQNPSPKTILHWQRWLRTGLETLGRSDERLWHIRPRGLSYMLERLGSRLVSHSVLNRTAMTEWFKDFTYQTFAEARDLRFCELCGDPFIRVRRQAYCSPKCSQKVRTEKFRRHHRQQINERRRLAYEKSQRAKHGPRVKVERRGAQSVTKEQGT